MSEDNGEMVVARNQCEKYCSFQGNCWGCTVLCEGNCSWHAITDCTSQEIRKGEIQSGITQKPGNITKESQTDSVFLT